MQFSWNVGGFGCSVEVLSLAGNVLCCIACTQSCIDDMVAAGCLKVFQVCLKLGMKTSRKLILIM